MTRRSALWAIALLIPMMLYSVGLSHGFPRFDTASINRRADWLNPGYIYHPDEFAYVGIPYRMLVTREWNPHYYHNPPLNLYTNLVFFVLTGADNLLHDRENGDREIAPFGLYFSARYLSALYTLLMVSLVYAAGRVAFGRRAGWMAAAIAGLAPLSVQHAHYATPNAQTMLLASAALLAGLVIFRRAARGLPMWLVYSAAGLLVGLTISARYNAAVVGLVVGLAIVIDWTRHRRWLPLAAAAVSVPLGIALGIPGIVLATREVVDQVREILDWYRIQGGGPGFTAERGLESYYLHLRYLVLMVLGPVVVMAAIAGLSLALWRWRSDDRDEAVSAVLLTLYALVYAVIALAGRRLQANLLPPLIAPLALLAGYAFARITARWNARGRSALAALLLAWPTVISVLFAIRIASPDTRISAEAWINEHVPAGTSVYLLGPYNVPVDPQEFMVTQTYGGEAQADDVRASDAQILVYSDAYPFSVLRDPDLSTTEDLERERAIQQVLAEEWTALAHFERWPWPGENLTPDDVSYWHQIGITIYCNPANCPVETGNSG